MTHSSNIQPQCHDRYQVFSVRTTTWRRFKHHAPPRHHMSERGLCRGEICRLDSMASRLPWDGVIVPFPKATYDAYFFLPSTKRHSTNDNSCRTSSFGYVDCAISVLSLSLRDEPTLPHWVIRYHTPLDEFQTRVSSKTWEGHTLRKWWLRKKIVEKAV